MIDGFDQSKNAEPTEEAATAEAARAAALERFRRQRAAWPAAQFSTQEILDARHDGHRAQLRWPSSGT